MTRKLTFVAASAAAFWILPAGAAVKQLDGTVLPQPSPSAEISVVTSRGFPASADSLSGLFQTFAGGVDHALDPVVDASTTPGTFDPTCGLKVSILLQGGGCALALGWYNAGQPPSAPATVYPVVPANLMGAFPNGIGCQDPDFCPMASRNTDPVQGTQHTWADPLPAFDPQIASNPNWQGGPVGFALIGSAGGQCAQTKYSEAAVNQKSTSYGAPWVTVLVYPSMAAPGAVYLAFEDSPMSAADWKQYGADGDFNDHVYLVAPTPCASGGGGASGAAGGAAGASGGGGGASGASGAGGGAGGAACASGASGAGGGTSGAGGASGAPGGVGGQTSSTGGQVATGGFPGTGGSMGGKPPVSGAGGCGCQTAGGPTGGSLFGLLLVALARLRRRSKSVRIRCS